MTLDREAATGDYWEWTIGCLPCVESIQVEASNDGFDRLRLELGDDIPMRPGGTHGSEHASCGLSALNGKCRNSDTLMLLANLLEEGQIEGVRVSTVSTSSLEDNNDR